MGLDADSDPPSLATDCRCLSTGTSPVSIIQKKIKAGRTPRSEFSRFAPGSMPGIPQNGRLHILFHAPKTIKMVGFADHFGRFWA